MKNQSFIYFYDLIQKKVINSIAFCIFKEGNHQPTRVLNTAQMGKMNGAIRGEVNYKRGLE